MLQGTQIEATLWREAAERFYDVLQEGKASTPAAWCLNCDIAMQDLCC